MTSTELPPSRPKGAARPRRIALLLALVAAAVLLPTAAYFAWQTWFADADPADRLLTAAATRGNLEDTVTATGTLQPKEFVDVGTQVSGQIRKLHVDIGAVVAKGQLLAEIDPSVYQAKVDGDRAQLQNQQAQLADRQAQLVLADLQLRRQQNMTKDDATTAEALQAAAAGRESALAQVNSVKAQMQQTRSTLRGDEASLGYTRIYAPIAGTVVSQAAKQGQTLNANQQAPIVMRIADLSTMTVQAQVSEADVSKLRVGMEVYFTTLGGDNRRYRSTLRQIPPTPAVVNNVVLYDALFDVKNPTQTLMTQMTAQVFFVIASAQDAVLVPLPALHPVAMPSEGRKRGSGGGRGGASGSDPRSQFANGRAMVSVVAADGKVTEREVKVGVMNRVSAQIISGLEPGENVVIGSKATATATRAPAANAASSALVPSAGRTGGRP